MVCGISVHTIQLWQMQMNSKAYTCQMYLMEPKIIKFLSRFLYLKFKASASCFGVLLREDDPRRLLGISYIGLDLFV